MNKAENFCSYEVGDSEAIAMLRKKAMRICW